MPLIVSLSNTHLLNRKNGDELWKSDMTMQFGIPGKPICIATKGTATIKFVSGINLVSGRQIWEYKENGVNDLESVILLGDTTLVVSSRGIHYINIKSGNGFSHNARMDYAAPPNNAAIIGGLLGGIVGSAIAGAVFNNAQAPSPNVVGNKKSNMVVHDGIIYFASFKDLIALNMDGEVLWSKDLPFNLKSLSKIFIEDEKIYLINYGIVTSTETVSYGDIYLSANDPKTGDVLAESFPGRAKREFINDFILRDSTVVFILSNRIAEYTLNDFEMVKENTFGDPRMSSSLGNIVNPPIYLMTDGKLENRTKSNPEEIYMENANGLKIAFSPDFEIVAVVRKPNFYSFSQYAGPWMILENGTNAIVINENNEILNTIPFSNNLIFINGYFYDFKDDKFLIASKKFMID